MCLLLFQFFVQNFWHFYNTFIDGKGVLKIVLWIRRLGLNEEYMLPIIPPKKSKVTEIIVKWCHLKTAYCVGGIALNEIRNRGFWIINTSSIIKLDIV